MTVDKLRSEMPVGLPVVLVELLIANVIVGNYTSQIAINIAQALVRGVKQ